MPHNVKLYCKEYFVFSIAVSLFILQGTLLASVLLDLLIIYNSITLILYIIMRPYLASGFCPQAFQRSQPAPVMTEYMSIQSERAVRSGAPIIISEK